MCYSIGALGIRFSHGWLPSTPLLLPLFAMQAAFHLHFPSSEEHCRVPLFPVLFILALEPLTKALRADSSINVIRYEGKCYKVNMFADYALLTLSKPIISLPNLESLLTHFATISGL